MRVGYVTIHVLGVVGVGKAPTGIPEPSKDSGHGAARLLIVFQLDIGAGALRATVVVGSLM